MDTDAIRERVWDALEDEGFARFPFPPHGRIPNVEGADRAADRIAEHSEWQDASTIKVNPDAPQLPVRRRALREGKTLYVAVPRLKETEPFVELDPDRIDDVEAATTVSGISKYGELVGPADIESVDLIISGSVAVTTDGVRLGKGEGYSDLEFGLLAECGLVDDHTPVATTVHERQVLDCEIVPDDHDVPMDLIVTADRTVRPPSREKPNGIDWSRLGADRRAEMPALETRAPPDDRDALE